MPDWIMPGPDHEPTLPDVVAQLGARKADAVTTLAMLGALRERVVEGSARLENPRLVLEYVDYFAQAIHDVVDVLDQLILELPQRADAAQVQLLREIAANCRTEQRRCLIFRDQCINRPLPDEQMRPLLNDVSVTTRDQLTAFYDLGSAAARLERILPAGAPAAEARRVLDRRQLFTRLFTSARGAVTKGRSD